MTEEKKPLKLKAGSPQEKQTSRPRKDWRVLVVDDDEEVHAVTRMILGKMRYKDRAITLLSAYSAAEARVVMENEKDIAVVLLDVVMETDDAGLQLVKVIREEIFNTAVRIILRTGQPGQAPEERVIADYDINDYKAKSELTAQKLFTTVIAALRSYETIVSLVKTRKGLEKILDSSSALFQVHSIQNFASGVLMQLSGFLECQPNGIICVQPDQAAMEGEWPCSGLQILASTGEYCQCTNCLQESDCKHTEMLQLIHKALAEEKNQLGENYTVLYFKTGNTPATAALLHGGLCDADENDRQLLEVFASKISLAFSNAIHYQKMITAEAASTIDFLTGLNNRRQLLRIGVPLVAGANRSGKSLAVAMIDIDHFKEINDTYGHDAGDEVLKRIATLMKDRFRSSDVVARFGGEEFCVIASSLTPQVAYELFDEFRRSLEETTMDINGESTRITVSIGISTLLADSVDAMISAADQMLYRAKQDGRNRVVMDS
ncbi:MAG: diguanylate cyclase [Gammaproteobacteria bacterium]|nr:diguanylate cyclase [Gammaproteobacteria bacterium]MBU1624260.1 diguanylate cyclase [Gammaproteobacteria bacterium]MBU1981988.1 diguanylate cyclase [Gammaproteobacteria bacterium]